MGTYWAREDTVSSSIVEDAALVCAFVFQVLYIYISIVAACFQNKTKKATMSKWGWGGTPTGNTLDCI